MALFLGACAAGGSFGFCGTLAARAKGIETKTAVGKGGDIEVRLFTVDEEGDPVFAASGAGETFRSAFAAGLVNLRDSRLREVETISKLAQTCDELRAEVAQ